MMTLLRVLLPIAMFLGLATWAVGVPNPKLSWPDVAGDEQMIASFAMNDDVTGTSPRCARWSDNTPGDDGCGNSSAEFLTSRDYTISRVDIVTGPRSFNTTEACDVQLRIQSPAGAAVADLTGVAVFQMGSSTVGRTAGNNSSQTGLSVLVSAGDSIEVQHTTPDPDTYCVAAGSCVCTAANGSYYYHVFGSFK